MTSGLSVRFQIHVCHKKDLHQKTLKLSGRKEVYVRTVSKDSQFTSPDRHDDHRGRLDLATSYEEVLVNDLSEDL